MNPYFNFNSFLIFCFLYSSSFFSQGQWIEEKGQIKTKKEITYWDLDSTKVRSIGFYNNNSFNSVGQRVGEWKFYNKDGIIEEITRYYMGLKHGRSIFYYSNGKPKIKAFYFLGLPDSTFSAFYRNGQLAEQGEYSGLPESFLSDTSNFMDWQVKLAEHEATKIGYWNYYYENGAPFQTTLHKVEDTTEYIMEYFNLSGEQLISEGNGKVETYYFSGKQKVSKEFKNGVPNGPFIEWNANGSIRKTGNYLNGLKNGVWKERYFVEDQDFQLYEYKNGNKHGRFVEFLVDGTKVIEGNYANGMKDGLWSYFFENGKKDMNGSFKNGKQDGDWEFWYPNGQLYYKGTFNQGDKTGAWIFYYKNGKTWRKGNYFENKKDGSWISWYENDSKAFEGKYSNGMENGSWTSWYENGQQKDFGSYQNGLMTGNWKGWYPNGKQKYEGPYENDLKSGFWKYWTDKGILKDQENYKIVVESSDISKRKVSKSYKHGYSKSFDEIQGKLVSEGSYYKSKQDGVWKYYFPGGEISNRELNYKRGKLNGISKEFGRRGNIKSEISYKNNKKHGAMKVYSNRGKMVLHVLYKDGVKTKDILKNIDYNYSKPKE